MIQAASAHAQANPHALASILAASGRTQVVASHDIVDETGIKLWSKSQPVSPELQQKLLDRKLRQPLEACLRAPDGVDAQVLLAQTLAILDGDGVLGAVLRPWAAELQQAVAGLHIHPTAQLLLTALKENREAALDHACESMLLAGAIALSSRSSASELSITLLGGLLHDIGELYIQPDFLEPDWQMTPDSYRHLVVHPRIADRTLTRMTDYPPELCRGVGEHHERGTGMGYPTHARALSHLGGRLSAVEAIVGILANSRCAPWAHASLALRLIPGEFSAEACAFVSKIERNERERLDVSPLATVPAQEIWEESQRLRAAVQFSLGESLRLAIAAESVRVSATAKLAAHLLQQLSRACNALGLWAHRDWVGSNLQEVQAANGEIAFRLQAIERIATWLDTNLNAQESAELQAVWSHFQAPSTSQSRAA